MMIPLGMWAGGQYPYICKLDLIDGADSRQLESPSSFFYISDTPNAPTKIWSKDGSSQVFQNSSANPTTTQTCQDSSENAENSTRKTPSSSISRGAIAGAVIGAAIGGALIAGLGTFLGLRRQKNRNTAYTTFSDHGHLPQDPSRNILKTISVENQEVAGANVPTAEMGEREAAELDSGRRENQFERP
ncbi:MAG: hypothetical protein Q9221_003463 [Calogaya cf. arnoldii]